MSLFVGSAIERPIATCAPGKSKTDRPLIVPLQSSSKPAPAPGAR